MAPSTTATNDESASADAQRQIDRIFDPLQASIDQGQPHGDLGQGSQKIQHHRQQMEPARLKRRMPRGAPRSAILRLMLLSGMPRVRPAAGG